MLVYSLLDVIVKWFITYLCSYDRPMGKLLPSPCIYRINGCSLALRLDLNLQEVYNLYEMFHTRYSLHKRAYQHKVVKGVELM